MTDRIASVIFRLRALAGFLIWCVLRVYVVVARRPRVEIARGTITRWFLDSTPTGDTTGPPGWYLHRFNGPDYSRDEHCHPWSWAHTYILRGGYTETRKGRPYVRLAGMRATFRPQDFHRTTSILPGTWTLFHAGPKSGAGWGFMVDGVFRRANKGAGLMGEP